MLQNSRVTTFSVFELLRENQPGGGGKITPRPPLPPPTPRLVLRTSIDFFPAKRKTYNKTFDLKFSRNDNVQRSTI